jgi:hypothetical protein
MSAEGSGHRNLTHFPTSDSGLAWDTLSVCCIGPFLPADALGVDQSAGTCVEVLETGVSAVQS